MHRGYDSDHMNKLYDDKKKKDQVETYKKLFPTHLFNLKKKSLTKQVKQVVHNKSQSLQHWREGKSCCLI